MMWQESNYLLTLGSIQMHVVIGRIDYLRHMGFLPSITFAFHVVVITIQWLLTKETNILKT
jgi:hypothetical protein